MARVAKLEQIPEEERLNPEKVIETIEGAGTPAFYAPTVDEIVSRLKPLVKRPDVIVTFSNGGFGGIHNRLLNEL